MTHQRRPPRPLTISVRQVYTCEWSTCPACATPLQLAGYYSWAKTVQHLDGVAYVASRPKLCANPACPATGQPLVSAAAQTSALPRSTYGLDVLAQVGWWRDHDLLSGTEIYQRLLPQVQISRRQVDLLLAQYRVLRAAAERIDTAALTRAHTLYGGLILGLDGVQPEGGGDQLWLVREILSGQILVAAWLPRVTTGTLQTLVAPVVELLAAQEWALRATISDKQQVVQAALTAVWPAVPHQWCQAHYFANLAAPLQERDHSLQVAMRKQVREQIGASIRAVVEQAEQGPMAPQLVSGVAVSAAPRPPPSAPSAEAVVAHYGEVLQQCLSRSSRNRFDLAGCQLYDDLQTVAASLTRSLAVREHLILREWADVLATVAGEYAAAVAEIRAAAT